MLKIIQKWLTRVFASNASNPESWFVEWVRGTTSDSGIPFNETTALQYPPIWYAVNKIGGHIGSMPLLLYESLNERERNRAKRHPSYRLMKTQPNEWMTADVFKEVLTSHALLWGNGRAAIIRDGNRMPASLEVIDPTKTTCVLVRNTETDVTEKWHCYLDDETHQQAQWPDRDVLHIQGLGSRGFEGYSVVALAKNSLGLGLAAEKAGNKLFSNNAVPELILEAPVGTFSKQEDAEEFLQRFKHHHEGGGGVGLLRAGIQAKPLTMPSRDAQFVDQRKFQRQEAALWMLLEQILGDDSSVSYNSLEQKNLAYLTNCLLRWLVKWEQECNSKLLTAPQQSHETHFFKFTTSALLRGTTKERYEVYQIGRQIEVLSQNDVRLLEDMNPIEDGDSYINPAINPKDKNADAQIDATFQKVIPQSAAKLFNYETQSRTRKMCEDRITGLINAEVRRVREAAAKHTTWLAHEQGDFISWMDKFYPSFECRIASGLGDAELAKEYVEESRRLLLEVAGAATNEELADMITSETSGWVDRARPWAQRAMEINNDG